MKKLFYILFTFHISLLAVYTQPVSQKWVRKHPSPISQYTQFQLSIGTPNTDVAHSIIQTTDGGYAVAGYTWQGGFYAYIAKLDASCTLQWTRTFGGTGWDDISSIIQTIDGGYIAAGTSIFKLDANGTLEWCENISGGSHSIIQTSDGGYAVAGYTNTFGAGDYDMFIVKLNSSGTLQWARTVGGTNTDYAESITQSSDGNFVVAGWSWSFGARSEIFIVKLNASGTPQWARTVGGAGDDKGYSIIQTTDGGFAVAGYTQYVEGLSGWLIVKLVSTGTIEWSRIAGEGAQMGNETFSIIKTMDGGYAVGGVKDALDPAGDMYIIKYDSSWNTCGSNDSLVSSSSGTWGTINSVTPTITSPTGFITPRTPTIGSVGTLTPICVTGIQPISNKIPVSFKLYQNYPNPFNPSTKIKFDVPPSKGARGMITKLCIYDLLGREVAVLVNEKLDAGTYIVNWNGENYSTGMYFYRMTADGNLIDTKKFILLK